MNRALEDDTPTILAGDFNLAPDTESVAIVNKQLTNLISKYNIKYSRPDFADRVDRGLNVVDYVFVNNKIKVNDFKVIDTHISDHLPLVLDFDIK